jgi:hypothetical protein
MTPTVSSYMSLSFRSSPWLGLLLLAGTLKLVDVTGAPLLA